MSPVRVLIFMLLAGILTYAWEGMETLNSCSGLDWRRAFAVHLWYVSHPSVPIGEILELYNNAFQDEDPYACPPVPWYGSPTTARESPENDKEEDNGRVSDTCYHLLQLYCNQDYDLGSALLPSGSTPYQLDYRLR